MSPRRKVADPWPFAGDSPLDRARRIAESYRSALLKVAPDVCATLDSRAQKLGQGWVVPQRAVTDESLDLPLDAETVAAFCYVLPTTVDRWVTRGLRCIDTPYGRRFTLRDVLEYQKDLRERRAASRKVG